MRKNSNVLWHRLGAAAMLLTAVLAGMWIARNDTLAASQQPEAVRALERQGEAFRYVAKKVKPAVVFIEVERTPKRDRQDSPFRFGGPDLFGDDLFRRFFGPEQQDWRQQRPRTPRRQHGQGSGFIVSEDGYIITNNHIVDGMDEVDVTLSDGREFSAKVVGTDPPSDIAVIKIDAQDLPTLEIGDSSEVDVGQWVLAIGNPFGLSHTVTAGIVSATGRSGRNITQFEDFIQTDAAINPGNSGGPLVDLHGRVVGMNTAILSQSGGYMGIGFAIPINTIAWTKDQILDNGSVTRAYLGVYMQQLSPTLSESYGVGNQANRGVILTQVIEGDPAEKAGLERGDIIVELGGQPVSDVGDFKNRVAMSKPGKEVDIVVLRDGQRKTIRVTMGEREGGQRARSQAVPKSAPEVGFAIQELTDGVAAQFGYEGESGVIVTHVNPGSDAAEQGIQPGTLIQELNRQPVDSPRRFDEVLREAPIDKPLVLLVRNGEGVRFVVIEPTNN